MSFSYYSILYYIPLVFFGANLILNLTRAIITISFNNVARSAVNAVVDNTPNLANIESEFEVNDDSSSDIKYNNPDTDSLEKNNLNESSDEIVFKRKMDIKMLKNCGIKNIVPGKPKPDMSLDDEFGSNEFFEDSHVENAPKSDSCSMSYVHTKKNSPNTSKLIKSSNKFIEKPETFRRLDSKMYSFHSQSMQTNQSKNTIKRIKTALTFKHDFFSNYAKNPDQRLVVLINDHYETVSESSADIIPKIQKNAINPIYSFRYQLSDEFDDQQEVINELHDKYSTGTINELKLALSNLFGIQKTFYTLKINSREKIFNVSENDRHNRNIVGE